MGMYTEFNIGVALKKNTPSEVIDILKYMVRDVEDRPSTLPDHPLFKTDRWFILFTCGSYYFDGETNSMFNFDDIDGKWYLTVRSSLKNYCSEIEKFLDWIRPYLYTTGFLGYFWYEEYEDPILIYNNVYENVIELHEIYDDRIIKNDISRYY